MSEEEKKTEVQKAMEKDCIILVAVEKIGQIIQPTVYAQGTTPDVKCQGPSCAQYNQFANVCGLR